MYIPVCRPPVSESSSTIFPSNRLGTVFLFSILMVLCALYNPMHAMGEPVYVDGEGWVEPTPNSQVPFDPSLFPQPTIQTSSGFGTAASGYTVTVNPLVDNFPDVVLFVTVLDLAGDPVTGLTQGDFLVSEQSETESTPTQETITCFDSDVSGNNGISFSLVFDVSGSMDGSKLTNAKQAAINFLNATGTNDRASLVKFESVTSTVKTSNWVYTDANGNGIYDIIEAIQSLTANGGTAVYDGTGRGIGTLTQEPEPKAVIVFTDGDTNSDTSYNINTVIQYALNQGVSIYPIGLGSDVVPGQLTPIATQTGGTYYYAPSAQDMEDIYNDIAKDIRNQYQLCYTTHNPAFDATLRTVTVDNLGDIGTATYRVNSKPIITLDAQTLQLHTESQVAGNPITISGTVTDSDAQPLGQSLTASITYSTSNANPGTYTTAGLTLSGPDSNGVYTFSFQIASQYVQEPGIIYYLRASDGVQETYSPVEYLTLPHTIAVLDNHAPTIVHTPVTTAEEGMAIDINATVTDPDATDTISKVTLYYRVHNSDQTTPYHSIDMTNNGSNGYSVQIPADVLTSSGVDYFISAWDSNMIRADHGTALSPHFFSIRNRVGLVALPKTGQKTCYNTDGNLVECSGTGQDGDIRAGVDWPEPRFKDNEDGTITDLLTGLVWLKNANRFGTKTWSEALNNCNSLSDNGLNLTDGSAPGDWRLPNILEIESLFSPEVSSPAIWLTNNGFLEVQSSDYWSSSTDARLSTHSWSIELFYGCIFFMDKSYEANVWPVRGESSGSANIWRTGITTQYGIGDDGDWQKGVSWPSPRFIENGDGTVTDNLTGLVWLKNANCFGLSTWSQALGNSNTLAEGLCSLTDGSSPGDWRLPNRKEILSLIDYSKYRPALPEGIPFDNVQVYGSYWSSTSIPGNSSRAWRMYVVEGKIERHYKTASGTMYAWPVRDLIDLERDLVAYYPFNGDADDESGNGNHGTVNGATLTEDRFGNCQSAYSFDGIDDYIEILDNPELRLNETDFTLSAWVYEKSRDVSNADAVLYKRGSDSEDGWIFGITGETNLFGTGNLLYRVSRGQDPYAVSAEKIELNGWHHVLVKYQNETSTMTTYIDGVLDTINPNIPSPNQFTVENLLIGKDSSDLYEYFFDGVIDDVRVYRRALSEAEIQALYNEGDPVNLDDGLVAYYPFNGNANDASGNGNDGTEYGGVSLAEDRFGNADSAYDFDGRDDHVEILSSSLHPSQFTFSAWLNLHEYDSDPNTGSILFSNYSASNGAVV